MLQSCLLGSQRGVKLDLAYLQRGLVCGAESCCTVSKPHAAQDEETIYEFANTGKCIDVFAPGVDIYAACGSKVPEPLPPHKYQYMLEPLCHP